MVKSFYTSDNWVPELKKFAPFFFVFCLCDIPKLFQGFTFCFFFPKEHLPLSAHKTELLFLNIFCQHATLSSIYSVLLTPYSDDRIFNLFIDFFLVLPRSFIGCCWSPATLEESMRVCVCISSHPAWSLELYPGSASIMIHWWHIFTLPNDDLSLSMTFFSFPLFPDPTSTKQRSETRARERNPHSC